MFASITTRLGTTASRTAQLAPTLLTPVVRHAPGGLLALRSESLSAFSAAFSTAPLSHQVLSFFVKRAGDVGYAKVSADAASDVADLTKAIVTELPSLRGFDLSSLALRRVLDAGTNELGAPLDSTLTIEEAALGDRTRIVVEPPLAAAVSGSQAEKWIIQLNPFYDSLHTSPPCDHVQVC